MCTSAVRAASATPVRLVHHPCPVCGGRHSTCLYPRREGGGGFGYCARKLLRASTHFALVRCSSCSMVYADPRPTGDVLRRIYRGLDDSDYTSSEDERVVVFHDEVELLGRQVSPPGRLLDVGCARGYFLDAAASAGWRTYGVEVSEAAASAAAAKGHDVVLGDLSDAAWPDSYFRVVTMWDVLEHLDSPRLALTEVSRLLEPGGIALVMTPDLSSAVSRSLGERWWSMVEMHLHYFTPRTLGRLLALCGLHPTAWATYPKRITVGYAARWLYSWGLPGSILARLLHAGRLTSLTLSFDPRDQMKVYARKQR